MNSIDIRESSGVYALDLNYPTQSITIYFNSHKNALAVKQIIELDRRNKITAVEAARRVAKAYYDED